MNNLLTEKESLFFFWKHISTIFHYKSMLIEDKLQSSSN